MSLDFDPDQIRTAVVPQNTHRATTPRQRFHKEAITAAIKAAYNHAVCLSRSARIFQFTASVISGLERHSGQPLRILYIGETEVPGAKFGRLYPRSEALEKHSNYRFIMDSAYSEYSIVAPQCQVSGIAINKIVNAYKYSVDLIFIDAELLFTFAITGSDYLAIPQWIEQKLFLQNTWDEVFNKFSAHHRKEVKRILKRGYRYVETRSESHCTHFYNDMYLPYVTRRFGGSAVPNSYESIMRHLATDSDLLLVLDGHQVVWGCVRRYEKDEVIGVCHAAAEGLMPDTAKGASTAMYYFMILRAFETGHRIVNFMGSRPFLETGIFQYKRRWGSRTTSLGVPLGDFYLKVCNLSHAVQAFLSHNPFIARTNGRFVGKIMRTEPITVGAVEQYYKRYQTEGIEWLDIFCLASIPEEIQCHVRAKNLNIRLYDISRSLNPVQDYYHPPHTAYA